MTPPLHISDVVEPERQKYRDIWALPQYQEAPSPGLEFIDAFMTVVQPTAGETLIDLGCGSGKAGLALAERGLDVTWMDLTDTALDPAIDRARFIEAPIWSSPWRNMRSIGWNYGYCCDVLEHLPKEYTMLAIERILRACALSWFLIAHLPDEHGKLIGEALHMTVEPFKWWLDRLSTLGTVIDARDLCGRGLFLVQR